VYTKIEQEIFNEQIQKIFFGDLFGKEGKI